MNTEYWTFDADTKVMRSHFHAVWFQIVQQTELYHDRDAVQVWQWLLLHGVRRVTIRGKHYYKGITLTDKGRLLADVLLKRRHLRHAAKHDADVRQTMIRHLST